jgi:hypothetical protein
MSFVIDWATLLNWIFSGLIALIFGIIGTWATYRFERKRDDIRWQRDKQQLEEQWNQKLREIELQLANQAKQERRDDIVKGLDDPARELQKLKEWIRSGLLHKALLEELDHPDFAAIFLEKYKKAKSTSDEQPSEKNSESTN